MKKKIISLLFAAVLISGIVYGGINTVSAKTMAPDSQTLKTGGLEFKSNSCYLADFETGTVMFEHNATVRKPIASMVKIMTLLLSFEEIDKSNLSIDDTIRVSENAANMGGSQAFDSSIIRIQKYIVRRF